MRVSPDSCYKYALVKCVQCKHRLGWLGVVCVGASMLRCAVYDASLAVQGTGGASGAGASSSVTAGDGGAGQASGAGGIGVGASGATVGTSAGAGGAVDPGTGGATNVAGAVGAGGSAGLAGAGGTGGPDASGIAGGAGVGGTGAGGSAGAVGAGGAAGSGGGDAGKDVTEASAPPPVVYVNSCSHVHWVASASSADTVAGDVAAHAVDGYAATRWTTGRLQGSTDFLQIDLGASVTLSQVVLDNTGGSQDDYPRSYAVLLSTDGTTFPTTAAMAAVSTPPGAMISIPITPQAVRAVKIVNSGTAGVWWSVDEVRLGCQLVSPPPQGAIDPYDPVTWKVSASVSAANTLATDAIDSDLATRWSSGQDQAGGETFLLDLGAVTAVSAITLDAPGAADFPAGYALFVSTDGQAYEQVATGVGATITRIAFARKNARYLRITQTGTDPAHWWSINEISIEP